MANDCAVRPGPDHPLHPPPCTATFGGHVCEVDHPDDQSVTEMRHRCGCTEAVEWDEVH